MTFNPDRFMDSQTSIDPDSFVFGFGRRKCPGIEVAHSTIFIIIATCLAVFEFGHPQVDGKEKKLREEFISGSVMYVVFSTFNITRMAFLFPLTYVLVIQSHLDIPSKLDRETLQR